MQQQLADFQGGCNNATSRARCASVLRDGREAGKGFVIAANGSYVALYDPAAERVLVLERAGASMQGAPNRLAYPPSWSNGQMK